MQRFLFCMSLLAVCVAVVAGCTPAPAPAPAPVRPAGALVASIRAAGAHDASVIQVTPLRDPAVGRLLDRAHYQKSVQRYQAAANTLNDALKLSPKAPDILQDRAQLAVRLGDYVKAEKLARRSFQLGPKVGGLCARNWQTVLEMRRIAKDPAGVQTARKALAKCVKSGPVRM